MIRYLFVAMFGALGRPFAHSKIDTMMYVRSAM